MVLGLSVGFPQKSKSHIFRLLDEATYKDLLAIKDIRNRFAHTSRFVNFRSEEINTACKRLSGWQKKQRHASIR